MEMIVGIPFTLVGSLFLFLTVMVICRSIRRLRDWQSTTGHVVGYDESEHAGRRLYHPRVEFTARNGRAVTFAASTGSNRRSYRIGDCVRVLIDPANLECAELRSLSMLWVPTFFLSLSGLTFVGLGVSLILGWTN